MEFPIHKMPILVASFFLLVSFSYGEITLNNLVDSVCNQTINYSMCSEALNSNPQIRSVQNFEDLAKIALAMAISNANDSLSLINQMITTNTNGTAEFEALEYCAFCYEGVVGSFRSALLELDEDIMTANYDVIVAGNEADNCENELVSEKVQLPLVSDRNYQVKLYSSIGYVITDQLSIV